MKTREIIKIIKQEMGNVTAVADRIGVSRVTMHKRINRIPALKSAIDEARESALDDIEHVLHKRASAGEPWAVCFYLKTQGKRRGYQEGPMVQVNTAMIVNQDLSKLSDEQLMKAYEIAKLIEQEADAG